ncbi:MAG: hypothetical protein GX111_08940 [Clostridiales bacterium]|nr:hypothetical protein [Clostridiales bacterium]
MKKGLALVLAIALVFALFAGCNSKEKPDVATDPPTSGTDAPSQGTQAPQPTETEEPSPYNFAAGKYDVDERGFPTAPYEYELPLSTTDEVFTFWTTCWHMELVPEDGFGYLPNRMQEQELTGVNIEYEVVTQDVIMDQFAVRYAADDLCDITIGGTFYSTATIDENIEEGFYVNLYDYMEYMPNYIYQVTFDPADQDLYERVFYKKDIIATFYAIEDVAFIASNYLARGDWLDELGLDNDDIITWDDVHNMLTLFKANYCEFPFPMFSSIDMAGTYAFTSYDTLPAISTTAVGPAYQINGKVVFSHMNDTDREFMTMINQWYSDGLIDPSWSSYGNNTAFQDKTYSGQVGYVYMSPGEVDGYEKGTINDPDCRWDPIHKPLKTPGQVVHVGGEKSRWFYGSAVVSTKCTNIPLVVTWLDWKYSPSGAFICSYGPEGTLWEKDENGNPTATEWALSAPMGVAFAWLCMTFGFNALAEPGLEVCNRKYIMPGGDRMLAIHYYWDDYNYDGAYKWPSGVKFTSDQTDEINITSNDIVTYISENYSAFVDGSKPLSEWDAYVEQLHSLGIDRIMEIYQEAYDTYIASIE